MFTTRKMYTTRQDNRASGTYSQANSTVELFGVDSLEDKTFLGYGWTPVLYKSQHNNRSFKDDGHKLTTINGRKTLLLDASHGTPPGVREVFVFKRILIMLLVFNLQYCQFPCLFLNILVSLHY